MTKKHLKLRSRQKVNKQLLAIGYDCFCVFKDSNIGIPDIEGKTPLHWAASSKDPEAVNCVKIILVSSLLYFNCVHAGTRISVFCSLFLTVL